MLHLAKIPSESYLKSSFQNHDENNRNAMVSQSVILDLETGDRVQGCPRQSQFSRD